MGDRDDSAPRRVVIVGASLAGLFAAGACAGSGRRVIVLERDRLPADPVARPGFNPVYGQGITVAACQAVELRAGLARSARPRVARRLQRRLGRAAALPWAVATGQGLRQPTSEGRQSLAQSLFGAWAGEVGRLAARGDVRASRALARVYHLMASPGRCCTRHSWSPVS